MAVTVRIFATATEFSFSPPVAGASPSLTIEAPEGSQVLPVRGGWPDQLFVPAGDGQRLAWDAGEVVRAAQGRRGAFRFV